MEALPGHVLNLQEIEIRENGVFDFEDVAVLRLLLQEIAVLADIDGPGGDNLLSLRVNRRISNLCKKLFKIVKQRLIFL